jgi:hypothetical protein
MNIHIFGDSHALFNFMNSKYNNIINNYKFSITMHRVGREKQNFINFDLYQIKNNDIIVYQYGEVDCRCHIGKQLLLNRKLDEIVNELVNEYIDSINFNLKKYVNLKIIICCVPPTMDQQYYESINGPITHEFPFVGSNDERKYYTELVNNLLKKKCTENNFIFFDYYDIYNDNGTLKIELSDNICHISKNDLLLNKFYNIIDNL